MSLFDSNKPIGPTVCTMKKKYVLIQKYELHVKK